MKDVVVANEAVRGGAYRPPARAAHVDLVLDGNEGIPPELDVAGILAGGGEELLRRYPNAGRLEGLLAARHGVTREEVLVTAGADDAIDRCLRAFAGPERAVVAPKPTFEMISRYAALSRAEVQTVPWLRGPFPVEAFVAAGQGAGVLAVVSPNNPTGSVATSGDLAALSRAVPGSLLMVDLAYGDFADEDLTCPALELPNAVVLRSFSKSGGLAGLRVGYALGPSPIIAAMRAAGHPYSVSAPSLRLAEEMLVSRTADPAVYVVVARRERLALAQLCESLGLAALPSQGNFVCCESEQAGRVHAALFALGISVRGFAGRPGLDRLLRITCPGDEAQFARLCAALQTVMAPQAVLFDMDGVLADVSASYHEAIRAGAHKFGVEVTGAAIRAAKEEPGANNDWEVTRRLLSRAGVEIAIEQVRDAFEQAYQGTPAQPGLWTRESLIPEVKTLEALARRLPLGIVTGRPRGDAVRFLEQAGIGHLFRVLVCMEDAALKPDPAPVRLALDRLGVSRAWLLGDTPDDLTAARCAGVLPIGCLAPGSAVESYDRLQSAGAFRTITDVAQLTEMLP